MSMPLFSPSGSFKWIRISTSQSFPNSQIGLTLSRKTWEPAAYAQHVSANFDSFDVNETSYREKESEDDQGFTVTYHPEYLTEEDGKEERLQNAMSDLSVARRTRSKTSSRTASPSKQGRSRPSSPQKKGSRSPIKNQAVPQLRHQKEWHGPAHPRRDSSVTSEIDGSILQSCPVFFFVLAVSSCTSH
jgi:hypothetical protein